MKKTFPINVILGLTTGILLDRFNEIHALAEWVMGRPVYTHEFASLELCKLLRDRVLAQHPVLANVTPYNKNGPVSLEIYLRENIALYGAEREIKQGEPVTHLW
jgi:hypothetical protein